MTALPRIHVAVMGMERIVENWEEGAHILQILPMAAIGDDGDLAVSPAADEVLGNGIDDDCDGVVDAGDATRPNGLRGWADRVAEVLATRTDDFGYANLAIRGRNLTSIEGAFELDFVDGPLGDAGIFAIAGPTGAGRGTDGRRRT